MGMTSDIKGYHPYWHAITRDRGIRANIYDSLVMRDTDGNIIPGLAESWKVLDPTTWEFRLRKGVKFHNGEPFNAGVAKYALDIARSHKMSRERTFLAPVDEVEVVDDYTIRLKMKFPAPDFLYGLQWVLMMPKKLVEEKGHDYLITHPVGTGAFKFAEWKKDEYQKYVANPNWWRGKPKMDEVIYRPIPEGATRVAALLAGEVDIIEKIPLEDIDRITKSEKTRVMSRPGERLIWVGFDTFNKTGSPGIPKGQPNPFVNVKVREALAYAINREAIVKHVLNGMGEPADQLLRPTSPYYNPKAKARPHDPEKARALLKEAGYPNGFSVRLDCTSGFHTADEEIGVAIADQLSKVGIKAEVNALKRSIFIPMIRKFKISLYIFGAMNITATDLERILITRDASKGLGRSNYSQFKDKKMDTLLRKVMSTTDEIKRKEYAFELAEYFYQQVPFVPFYWMPTTTGISNKFEMPHRIDYQIRAYDIAPK
jgi:peptide/nickel transport system substrate-binding protein